LILLLVALLAGAAHGQYLGTVSQQTVQQTLATSLVCTGGAQNFPINNLGQTQHYLQIGNVTGAQFFTAEIDGIDNQGNIYRISDVLEMPGVTPSRQGTLRGSGYYPKIQASITCSPGTATFTASYSGSQFTYDTMTGSYLSAQVDKINFSQADATVIEQDNLEQTPFGSSAGTVIFSYSSGPTAPGTLAVKCSTNGFSGVTTPLSASLANATGPQIFSVPDSFCPFISVQYTPGTGGTVVQAEYLFAVPGRSPALVNASTLTNALNNTGAIAEKGARWTVSSFPGVGSLATASKGALVGIRHVADCVSLSAGATTAPVATTIQVNVRDGASGAGTVIWATQVTMPATTGTHGLLSFCGLNLIGSPNTAMTLEFNIGLANESESVTLTGYDVK
jgi:hypothetical protein